MPITDEMNCQVTGFEFMIEIGMNGYDKEEAKRNLDRIMPEAPYFFTDTATRSYIKKRMNKAGKLMGKNTDNGSLYEYHKGQFLAFREILYPDTYGKDVKEVDKDE